MSEEAGFLAAIQAAAADNAPRLVYADWLDEEGRQEQAEFIRLEVQCRQARCRLIELRATLDRDWTTQVFPANGLVLLSYPAHQKIYVIKLIREIVGCGLAEGKALAEQLPDHWRNTLDVGRRCVPI